MAAYEHAQEVQDVSRALISVLQKSLDGVQPNEILPLVADLQSIVFKVAGELSEEEKKAYKLKFIAKVLLSASSRSLDLLLPDDES